MAHLRVKFTPSRAQISVTVLTLTISVLNTSSKISYAHVPKKRVRELISVWEKCFKHETRNELPSQIFWY